MLEIVKRLSSRLEGIIVETVIPPGLLRGVGVVFSCVNTTILPKILWEYHYNQTIYAAGQLQTIAQSTLPKEDIQP